MRIQDNEIRELKKENERLINKVNVMLAGVKNIVLHVAELPGVSYADKVLLKSICSGIDV